MTNANVNNKYNNANGSTIAEHRFENGKIKEHNAISDDLAFILNFGLVVSLAQNESFFRLWNGVGDEGDYSNGVGAHLQ